MKFYTQAHKHYCGIDLHARCLYVCILDHDGTIVIHKNIKANPHALLALIAPYRDDLVLGVECMFSWYWVADLCREQGITFILGHALYMRAIHGGKAKNDKIDSNKIAVLMRGGMFPQAYVYPREMRATRDLMRPRMHLMRKRSELLAHVHNTNSQYNLPPIARASPNVSLTPVCTKASIWTSASSSSTTTNSARSNGIYKNTPPPVTSTA